MKHFLDLCLVVVFVGVVLCVSGCEVFTPNASKAFSEKAQLKELKSQNEILERIAVAIENK